MIDPTSLKKPRISVEQAPDEPLDESLISELQIADSEAEAARRLVRELDEAAENAIKVEDA